LEAFEEVVEVVQLQLEVEFLSCKGTQPTIRIVEWPIKKRAPPQRHPFLVYWRKRNSAGPITATVGLSPDGNITAQEHPISDFSRPKDYFSLSTVVAHN
jgi:hypothetical protein